MKTESWNYASFWNELKSQFQSEISEQEFSTWFKNINYDESKAEELILSVPSTFFKDQISKRYVSRIEKKLEDLSGNTIKVSLKVRKKAAQSEEIPEEEESAPVKKAVPAKKQKQHAQLKKEYTFDSFVIGENNSLAANAAIAIAKNPGHAYNPCFIYGGVGLGKTHLIQSIGNSVYRDFPEKSIIYVPAETFINDFINSIRDKKVHLFKNKYRSVDVLLLDDIHFFQKKTETQEELFHTFNALYDSNRQMVFTCDRPVSELRELTDRLRSRFERGLNVDLQPPNYETRIAILKKKVESIKIEIPDDVIELICKNVVTHVRDIEKALTKLIAYAELVNKNITLEIAQRQLSDLFSSPLQKNITIDVIKRVTAEYFGLAYNELHGKKRTKAIALPRQVAMYLSREMTEYSTTEIGVEFGGRDHTTVMHACQKIEGIMRTDSHFEPIINSLMRTIKEYKVKN